MRKTCCQKVGMNYMFINKEKEYNKKIQKFNSSCRVDHKLLPGSPCKHISL